MPTWREQLKDCERQAYLNELALHCVLCDKPDGSVTVKQDRERYTLTLYRAAAAHGGVLIVRYRYPNQRDSVAAHYFDTWRHSLPQGTSIFVQAASDLARIAHTAQTATIALRMQQALT